MTYDTINNLAKELAFDIFIADGGIDDFRDMDERTLTAICTREVLARLIEAVVTETQLLAKEGE
jgi:hypothetical protein